MSAAASTRHDDGHARQGAPLGRELDEVLVGLAEVAHGWSASRVEGRRPSSHAWSSTAAAAPSTTDRRRRLSRPCSASRRWAVTVVRRSSCTSTGTSSTARSAVDLLQSGRGRRALAPVERQRQARPARARPPPRRPPRRCAGGPGRGRRTARSAGAARPASRWRRSRRRRSGGCRGRGRGRAPQAGGRPAAARAWSSASARRDGSLAAGDREVGALPPPPPTVLAASAMRVPASSPLSGRDRGHERHAAAVRDGCPAPRPGCRAGPAARPRGRAGRRGSAPSTSATTMPSTACAHERLRLAAGQLLAQRLDLVAQRLRLVEPLGDAVEQLGRRDAHERRGPAELLLLAAQPLDRTGAGDRLDAAEVRADRALGHDLHRADVAERLHVGAAAQLGGVAARLEHPHDVAVLLAEERDGARAQRPRPWWSRSGGRARCRGSPRWPGPRWPGSARA